MSARDRIGQDDFPAAPPWSAEAEQAVLGALIFDPLAIDRLEGTLSASDFFDARHRFIFAAIAAMVERCLPVDIVTVFEHLRSRGQHEEAGGLAHLNALAQSVSGAANIKRYARIVRDFAVRRAVCTAADRARELALGSADEVDEVLDRVETLFAGLRGRRDAETLRSVAEVLVARLDYWNELHDAQRLPGIPTGIGNLDAVLGGGIKPGRNIVLAGRPGMGKTSLAWKIAEGVARSGKPVLVLSMEMQAGELIDRAVASVGRVGLDRLTSVRLQQEDWSGITAAVDELRELDIYIDDRPALTLLDIRARARQVRQQRGDLALVVVDYLQLASAVGDYRTRHHAIESISRGMKSLAKELGTTVLLLSQLTREAEATEPELHHLKESGAIEEDADAVLLLHPMGQAPEGGALVMVKVAKNRHGRRGRFGLAFDPGTQRWQASDGDVSRKP